MSDQVRNAVAEEFERVLAARHGGTWIARPLERADVTEPPSGPRQVVGSLAAPEDQSTRGDRAKWDS